MQIKQIHSMYWGDEAHTAVGLIADTDEGNNQQIGTPYDESSIIWADVQAFPADQIGAYVEPPPAPVVTPAELQAKLSELQAQIASLSAPASV